jgi:hypothetical protein
VVGRSSGRSLIDLLDVLRELHAKGVDLFLHPQGLDTSAPSGRTMFQMLGVSAQRHGSGVLAVGVNTSSCDFGCSSERSPGQVVG